MTHSQRWSQASAACRLEWRPSRWPLAALMLLALLAPLAVLASGLPRAVAWPLAAIALASGFLRARREACRNPLAILVDATGRAAVGGVTVTRMRVRWRGPLAFLSWRDARGRARHAKFWPDTLLPSARRELRLADPGTAASARRPSMAP